MVEDRGELLLAQCLAVAQVRQVDVGDDDADTVEVEQTDLGDAVAVAGVRGQLDAVDVGPGLGAEAAPCRTSSTARRPRTRGA